MKDSVIHKVLSVILALGLVVPILAIGTPVVAQEPPSTPTNPRPGSASPPGPILSGKMVTLEWDASPGTIYYMLWVYDANTDTVEIVGLATGTSYTVTLQPDTPYWWVVNAHSSAGTSPRTNPRYFRTSPAKSDLTLTTYASWDAVWGGGDDWYISVENGGDIAADDVILTVMLDDDVQALEISDDGAYDPNEHSVRWNLGSILPGSSREPSLTVLYDPMHEYCIDLVEYYFSVITTTPEYSYLDNEDHIVLPVYPPVQIGLDLWYEGSPSPGSEITFTAQYYNYFYGFWVEGMGENVVITDTLSDKVDFISASGNGIYADGQVTWELGSSENLEDGAVTVTVKVRDDAPVGSYLWNDVLICGVIPYIPSAECLLDGIGLKVVAKPSGPDLTVLKPLEFPSDLVTPYEPFEPKVLRIRALVENAGTIAADNVEVSFAIDGVPIEGSPINIGVVEPGSDPKPAEIMWTAPSNVQDVTLEVEAHSIGQEDADASDNTATQSFSFYFIPFRYHRNAFSFSNNEWEYSYTDELDTLMGDHGIIGKVAGGILGGWFLSLLGSSGHCFGMAAASTHWYVEPEDKPIPIDTYQMTLQQEEVKDDIIAHHWSSVLTLPETFASLLNYSPSEQYDKVLSDIKSGLPVVLALWDTSPQVFDLKLDVKQQHAVTAYAILDLGDEKRVYVYDNCIPLKWLRSKDHATYITSTKQFSFDEFNKTIALPLEYSLYTGSLTSLLENAADSLKEATNDLWTKGQMLLWGHSPVEFLLTDEYGRRIGVVNATFVNEIPGAVMEEPYDSALFILPLSLTYSLEMTGTEAGVLGLDLIMPVGECQARVVTWEDIPVYLGSRICSTFSSQDATYKLTLEGSGEALEADRVGEINALDISQTASTSALMDNVELYWSIGWLKNTDIRDGLQEKLQAAQASLDRGIVRTAMNQLKAFLHQVQSDGNVDSRARDYLTAYTEYLIDNL